MSRYSKSVEKYIERQTEKWRANIQDMADSAFEAVILPYLKKNRYGFSAGMGTYSFYAHYSKPRNYYGVLTTYHQLDIDRDIPAYIRDLVQLETGDNNSSGDLGLWMPDYDPTKESDK